MRIPIFTALFLLLFPGGFDGQITHGLNGVRLPWTDTPLVAGDTFRFIILPDRTGGEQSGIFDAAREVLNKQNPAFFVTIGDMIDGYTRDTDYLERMWRQYMSSISGLASPIFFTPGNHDISNPLMERDWKERFGYAYYHFRVGKMLFLILNSEENEAAGISDEQAAYFTSVIADAPSDVHILLFVHRPVWNSGDAGYARIVQQLAGRHATVFCGHEHRYFKSIRNGIPHYMVATLGGVNALRGVGLGEFHHFLIADVSGTEIRLTNMLADGTVIPDDVVNDGNVKAVDALRSGNWGRVIPYVSPDRYAAACKIQIVLDNPFDLPLRVSGTMPWIEGASVSPQAVDAVVESGKTVTLDMELIFGERADFESFTGFDVELNGTYVIDGQRITAPVILRYVVDYVRVCMDIPTRILCREPGYVKEGWDWKGVSDGSFEFEIRRDTDSLYLCVSTSDDNLIIQDDPDAPQDKLFICFDDHTCCGEGYAAWQFTATGNVRFCGTCDPEKYTGSGECRASDNSLYARLSIPLSQGMEAFRLNVGFMDHDNPLNTKPSVLWWKPLWDSPRDYPGAGKFEIINKQ